MLLLLLFISDHQLYKFDSWLYGKCAQHTMLCIHLMSRYIYFLCWSNAQNACRVYTSSFDSMGGNRMVIVYTDIVWYCVCWFMRELSIQGYQRDVLWIIVFFSSKFKWFSSICYICCGILCCRTVQYMYCVYIIYYSIGKLRLVPVWLTFWCVYTECCLCLCVIRFRCECHVLEWCRNALYLWNDAMHSKSYLKNVHYCWRVL